MSIFATLKQKISVAIGTTPAVNMLDCDSDEYLPAPSGSLFYDILPIPSGPGAKQIRDITDMLPMLDIKTGPWICGGAARRLQQGESLEGGDIDFFFPSRASWNSFCTFLDGFEVVIKTDRATTFLVNGLKVQCIKRKYYISLEDIFKDFDFSVCQIATDGRVLAATKQACLDITDSALRLAPCGTIAKHTLVQRMCKYVGYGFLPEPGLYELMVKGGMDYTNAYAIFEGNEVAVYDVNEGGMVEEELPTESIDAAMMRSIARDLGLELINE